MTYAIGVNKETCAAKACCQPAEVEVVFVNEDNHDDRVSIGFCLEHGIQERDK